MIEFQNVSVCYDPGARHPVYAIENLSLKIESGDWVFLVGPSGAGKSSLLKLLHCSLAGNARIEGKILLEGQDITRLSHRDIPFVRRRLGVVFQDFQLLAQKTAWENIAFALRVIGTPQSRISREVPRALDIVGLAHRAHAQPHELSGGEQQRIAIARAIVNNPTLLLADEPTGNLDPDTAAGIAEVLRRINEERGTTVVMATHDRHLVDTMRRRVVRVRDGKIVSDEASGVYHPEDDEPTAPRETTSRETTSAETALAEAAPESTPATKTPAAKTLLAKTPIAKISRPRVQRQEQAARERIEIREENQSEAQSKAQSESGVEPAYIEPLIAAPDVVSNADVTGVDPGHPDRLTDATEAADKEPSTPSAPPSTPSAPPSTPSAPPSTPSAPEVPRVRLRDPQDAITREALGNHAPLGSDENPIVQYGKR
jgi:cell division transport system ATP-binding protein